MSYHSAIGSGACDGLVDALRAEFGVVLAARIVDAEEVDFLWDARVSERYLGQHFGQDLALENDNRCELSRVAIISFLDGLWHVGVCVIDGDGGAVALLWQRDCERLDEAREAFERAS